MPFSYGKKAFFIVIDRKKKEGYTGQRISFFSLCISTKGDGRKFHDQTKGVFVCN